MSDCPRIVLAVSNLLMLSLLAVPLMLCLARAAEPGRVFALLPNAKSASPIAVDTAAAKRHHA